MYRIEEKYQHTLCERKEGKYNIHGLTLNPSRLEDLRRVELGIDTGSLNGTVYRFVTNDRYRLEYLLRQRFSTSSELFNTEKHFKSPSVWGYMEEHDLTENWGKLYSEEILKRYAAGMFDGVKTLPVEIEDYTHTISGKYFLLNKEQITRIKNRKIGMLKDNEEIIYLAEGIIPLTPTLFVLENILRGKLYDHMDSETHNRAIQVFDVTEQPIKEYSEADIAELQGYTGKELFSSSYLNNSAKVLELVRGRKEGI